jgi:hypothetical protein
MRPSSRTAKVLTILAQAAFAGAPAALEDYTVRRGQTISYIAFHKYGAFDDSIATLVRTDNPQIPDLDQVSAGQVVHLRRNPAESFGAEPGDPLRRVLMASRKAVVTLSNGGGEIRRARGGRERLAANRFLVTGDTVVTFRDGQAELIFDNQSVLRLGGGTEVVLSAIQEPRASDPADGRKLFTRISLLRGKTWTHVQKWAGSIVAYQVQMPNAIAGVHGTVFENAIAPDSSSSVSVIQGEVAVQGVPARQAHGSLAPKEIAGPREITLGQWIQILKDGQRLDIEKSGQAGKPVDIQPQAIENWRKIDQARDSL